MKSNQVKKRELIPDSKHSSKLASQPNSETVQLKNALAFPSIPLSASHLAQLQKTIGNRAVAQFMESRGVIQREHEASVEGGNVIVTGGRAEISLSRAGGSKKPLAVIEGTLSIAGIVKNVEIHVHLNANSPLKDYSGANIRYNGEKSGFAYWTGGTVDNTAWLKNILDSGIPNWKTKATWEAVDTSNEIAWQGIANAGWRFDEANRARDRRANTNYKVTFLISKSQGSGTQKSVVEGLCSTGVTVSIQPSGSSKRKVTLTYTNEQTAFAQSAEDEKRIKDRWSNTTFDYAAKTDAWT